MDANEMTFGIEIECTLPGEAVQTLTVGHYHRGVQIPGLPNGWNAQSDSSIQVTTPGHKGLEVVSPILKGREGLEQAVAVCKWLQERGAKVNTSTGFHVHVGWDGSETDLARLAHLVARNEKALYASTGTHSRETSTYCRPIANNAQMKKRFAEKAQGTEHSRFHTINVTNISNPHSTKKTIEFRLFAGTTNPIKVVSYVRLCVGLVQKARDMKRTTTWEAKAPSADSTMRRKGGEGATCVVRLFYDLGWVKGRCPKLYGMIEGAYDLATCRRKVTEMARKYDKPAVVGAEQD